MYANTPSPYVSDTIETKPFHSANQFNLIKSNRIELKSDKKEICFSSSFTLITEMRLPFAYPRFLLFPHFPGFQRSLSLSPPTPPSQPSQPPSSSPAS